MKEFKVSLNLTLPDDYKPMQVATLVGVALGLYCYGEANVFSEGWVKSWVRRIHEKLSPHERIDLEIGDVITVGIGGNKHEIVKYSPSSDTWEME